MREFNKPFLLNRVLTGLIVLASCSVAPAHTNTSTAPAYPRTNLAPKSKIVKGFSFAVVNNRFIKAPAKPIHAKYIPINSYIQIDSTLIEHSLWGFGGNVTDSCLKNINQLNREQRVQVMEALFSPHKGAGLNYVRVPIGANDYSMGDYTLNDTPNNEPDPELKHLSFKRLNPMLNFVKEARAYNPDVRVMLTPWTPPAWMKTTKKLRGGALEKQYFEPYANYLTRTAQYVRSKGLDVHSLSIMNEPLIDAWERWYYPQGTLSLPDQVDFIKNYLEPKLQALGMGHKILAHDHNWDNASQTDAALATDPAFRSIVKGVAYHCYGGTYVNLLRSLQAHPDMPAFNTECTATFANNSAKDDFQWWLKTQSLDAVRDGVAGSLGWNLCLDQNGGPRNDGCKNCRGLVTLNMNKRNATHGLIQLNSEYYALAQTSRYVTPGAHKIKSLLMPMEPDHAVIENVAIKNPDGSIVLVIRNPTSELHTAQLSRDAYDLGIVQIPAYGASTYLIK